MRNWNRLLSLSSLGLTTLFGCCTEPPPQPPATKPVVAAQRPPSRPFVVSEASLPAGFPGPGPVGVVQLKQYPACREARVESGSGEDSMFMSLFNHIQTNDIPMTSPVEMTWDASADAQPKAKLVAMAFVYGQATRGAPGTQGKVRVIDLPAQTVVSIGVRGGYNEGNLKAAVKKLDAYLAARPGEYQVTGLPRYLGYNSPFVPFFLQYGEVQLPVVKIETSGVAKQ